MHDAHADRNSLHFRLPANPPLWPAPLGWRAACREPKGPGCPGAADPLESEGDALPDVWVNSAAGAGLLPDRF